MKYIDIYTQKKQKTKQKPRILGEKNHSKFLGKQSYIFQWFYDNWNSYFNK